MVRMVSRQGNDKLPGTYERWDEENGSGLEAQPSRSPIVQAVVLDNICSRCGHTRQWPRKARY
jgi:hypothetical protein